jgi:hypothetical protein
MAANGPRHKWSEDEEKQLLTEVLRYLDQLYPKEGRSGLNDQVIRDAYASITRNINLECRAGLTVQQVKTKRDSFVSEVRGSHVVGRCDTTRMPISGEEGTAQPAREGHQLRSSDGVLDGRGSQGEQRGGERSAGSSFHNDGPAGMGISGVGTPQLISSLLQRDDEEVEENGDDDRHEIGEKTGEEPPTDTSTARRPVRPRQSAVLQEQMRTLQFQQELGKESLEVQKEQLAIDKERLVVEKERLEVEKDTARMLKALVQLVVANQTAGAPQPKRAYDPSSFPR